MERKLSTLCGLLRQPCLLPVHEFLLEGMRSPSHKGLQWLKLRAGFCAEKDDALTW